MKNSKISGGGSQGCERNLEKIFHEFRFFLSRAKSAPRQTTQIHIKQG